MKLAPNLAEAILNGDEPSGLPLVSLAESVPMEWGEQRRGFGAVDAPHEVRKESHAEGRT
jgi:hypothetical protein